MSLVSEEVNRTEPCLQLEFPALCDTKLQCIVPCNVELAYFRLHLKLRL
jgi:hypothetical protein